MKVVLTGPATVYGRRVTRDVIEDTLRQFGISVVERVTGDVVVVLCDDYASSTRKMQAARAYAIPVVSYQTAVDHFCGGKLTLPRSRILVDA